MPKRRYESREPTHDWQQIRPRLVDMAQITYEIIRPVVLWGQTPKERAAETCMSPRTIYYKANLFDLAGMASVMPPEPPPPVLKQDKRELPPTIRQEIVDLFAEYSAFRPHELATICFVKFGRKPSPQTVKLILASGPKPLRTTRRFAPYAETDDPVQRRRAIVLLHAEGWNAKSIAGYLDVSRQTVHTVLKRWVEEQFAGLHDKSSAPHSPAQKTTLKAVQEVKKLAENPELGAYRVSAALEQMGIKLSRTTCGRLLALNRDLYHLQMPRKGGRPKAEMPFKPERRHQFWSVDIRYLDMHRLGGGEVYCISILENFSRAVLASAISRRQDTEAYFAVLYDAIRRFGVPEVLVSDSGGVFLSHDARRVYDTLGIEKREIKKRRPYQNFIETHFNIMRRMGDWAFEKAQTWEDLLAAHQKFVQDYNFQRHLAHEKRDDNRHSPAQVLNWQRGMQPEPALVYRVFSAICETRTLTKAGYAHFRNFLLYGEQGLAGKKTLINIFQESLTLEYGEQPLSRYSVEWQPDDKHLLRVGNPRLYEHSYQSSQPPLWEPGEVEWHVIIRVDSPSRRHKRKGLVVMVQLPLFA